MIRIVLNLKSIVKLAKLILLIKKQNNVDYGIIYR